MNDTYKLLKKMHFKDYEKIYILGTPKELKSMLDEMSEFTTVKKSPNCKQTYDFALFFTKTVADISKYAVKADEKMNDDGLLWFAYPKKSSKNYKSDITRDNGWQPLGDLGYEAVSMVSVDSDWSAIRFRKADKIKTMKRNKKMVMSKKGKEKINNN